MKLYPASSSRPGNVTDCRCNCPDKMTVEEKETRTNKVSIDTNKILMDTNKALTDNMLLKPI